MQVRVYTGGYALIDQTYNELELKTIWSAIDHIQAQGLMQNPHDTGSAVDPRTGQVIKRNRSVFLDDLDPPDQQPDIRPMIANVWRDRDLIQNLSELHPCYSLINMINYSTSLLSYYEDSEHYPAHRDLSVFTILTWLWREPKSWQGGEICLPEFDLVHTVENNQSMIFPGSYLHEARAPVMTTSLPGRGRYCLAQFGYVKP
jgi:hypothetical protein